MSIDITNIKFNPYYTVNPYYIRPVPDANKVYEDKKEDVITEGKQNFAIENYKQNSVYHVSEPNSVYSNNMSTSDFLSLKQSVKDRPYATLDKVIEKMKENMEAVGDALETLSEMKKKTSKESLGLQILMETFKAIDELKSSERK